MPFATSRSPLPTRLSRLAAGLALTLAATACDQPAGPRPEPVSPSAPPPLAALRCTAEPRAGVVACLPGAPAAGAASGDLLVGGQGTNVQLSSSGVTYDGAGRFATFVTLANLLPQPMGTTDGTTPAPQGIRVFFAEGPTVVEGGGTAVVANADSIDAFTATGQPYFRYTGILAPGDTSAPREWVFTVSPEVERFEFTVYVAAPVPFEHGWVEMTPDSLVLDLGGADSLRATVAGPTGRTLPGVPVSWSSSDTTVVRVDATGRVQGRRYGSAVVTATAGPRAGRARVTVADREPPVLTGLSNPQYTPALLFNTIYLSAADSSGVVSVTVSAKHGAFTRSCDATRSDGTARSAHWNCELPVGKMRGDWVIYAVTLADSAGNTVTVDPKTLGLKTSFTLGGAGKYWEPELLGFSIRPDTVDARADTVEVVYRIETMEDMDGIWFVELTIGHSSGASKDCRAEGVEWSVFECRFTFDPSSPAGEWRVTWLEIVDWEVDVLLLMSGEIEYSYGHRSTLHVLSGASPP